MSLAFELSVVRVECIGEQIREVGKDEMHLLAYGITRRGKLFATGYRNLGSYGTGDVNKGAFPLVLHQEELADDGNDGVLFLMLIEEDGGGVRKAAPALDAALRADFAKNAARFLEGGFSRDCVSFVALYKSMVAHVPRVKNAATKGRDDQVYSPNDFYMRFAPTAPAAVQFNQELSFTNSKGGGTYNVFMRAHWERLPVVFG